MVRLLNLLMVLMAPVALSGAAIPPLEAETLTGEKVKLPELWSGRPSVVIWGFSKEAGEGVRAWMAALEQEGVNAWGTAVLEKAPRFVRPMIRRGMRGDFPKPSHGRVLCLYRGDRELRQALGVTDDRLPLVVVFDANGAAVWRYLGLYEQAARDELIELLRRLS